MIWLAAGLVYLVIATLAGVALGRHLRRIGATYAPIPNDPPQASRPPRAPAGPTSGAAQGGPALPAAPDPTTDADLFGPHTDECGPCRTHDAHRDCAVASEHCDNEGWNL